VQGECTLRRASATASTIRTPVAGHWLTPVEVEQIRAAMPVLLRERDKWTRYLEQRSVEHVGQYGAVILELDQTRTAVVADVNAKAWLTHYPDAGRFRTSTTSRSRPYSQTSRNRHGRTFATISAATPRHFPTAGSPPTPDSHWRSTTTAPASRPHAARAGGSDERAHCRQDASTRRFVVQGGRNPWFERGHPRPFPCEGRLYPDGYILLSTARPVGRCCSGCGGSSCCCRYRPRRCRPARCGVPDCARSGCCWRRPCQTPCPT
jgi:hypothetical protein